MRAARTDANHAALLQDLRELGWDMVDTHALPNFVDAVGMRAGQVVLMEFKTPKGKLTSSQLSYVARGWPLAIIRSRDEAVAFTKRDRLER